MADDHDTIDKNETPAPRRRTALATPLLGILLGAIGTVLMSYSFVNGISAALDGASGNTTVFIVLFFVGAAAVLIAIILGVVGLIRGGHRFLSLLSLLVGLVPVGVIAAVYIANRV